MKNTEVRYSATDREALAIVLACRQLHHYLWSVRFVIRTDHQPITSVFRQRTKSPRMNRWMLEMREYRLKVEYKKGKNNVVADQFSRPVRLIQESEDGTHACSSPCYRGSHVLGDVAPLFWSFVL